MRGGIPLAGVAALIIAIAGGVRLYQLQPPPPADGGAPQPPADSAAAPADEPADVARDAPASAGKTGRRPASLRGTRVDGALVTDADGRFVATADARRLFDYFLAASGEESDGAIAARVHAEIDRRLSPDAARDAHALFDRYLAYRARARTLSEQGLGDAALEARLATLRELRRETLGAEAADAFFAEEEEGDAVAIAKLRARQDENLSPEERQRRLAEAEAALPAAERARRRAAMAALELRAAEQALLAEGGASDDVRVLRERTVGPEAAERLAALDQSRAAWQRRVDDYHAARRAIDGDAALDAQARQQAIARLRAERFTATEQLRIEALDQIEAPGQGGRVSDR